MYTLFALIILVILAALGIIISRDNKRRAEKLVDEIKRFQKQKPT